ncbi:hypothetical protein B0H13DRAFT_1874251 [Mycena leptocephala]|nr:hypothetical protein B0H13DRAFT_1874251 [Mycena leptocephala]
MYPVSTNHHIHYCLWGGTRNQPQYWLDLMNKCTVNLARPAVRESRQNAGSHFARRLRITGVGCGESKFHTHITDISRSRKGGMLEQHEIELRGTRTHITRPEKKRDATKIWRERSGARVHRTNYRSVPRARERDEETQDGVRFWTHWFLLRVKPTIFTDRTEGIQTYNFLPVEGLRCWFPSPDMGLSPQHNLAQNEGLELDEHSLGVASGMTSGIDSGMGSLLPDSESWI